MVLECVMVSVLEGKGVFYFVFSCKFLYNY